MGAWELILHIHIMVNWQLLKQGIRWPVSYDRIAGSGVDVCVFFEVIRWQVTSYEKIVDSSLLFDLTYKFINGSLAFSSD